MHPIAECKWSDCDGDITVGDVHQVRAIAKAPHHLALVSQCPTCGRAGKYVIERTVWDEVQAAPLQQEEETNNEHVLVGAAIEVDAIDTADELIALWNSYGPPPMEVKQRCPCATCVRKRYA